MVSYNPEAVVFGFYQATLEWLAGGAINMTVDIKVTLIQRLGHSLSS
jgi:hypothetical protein